jgi:DJ-1 family protein
MSKLILIPISDGTEEMEAVIIADILRRAGALVTIAGLSTRITCSRGIMIIPDILLEDIDDNATFDAIIIPGGLKGVDNLSKSIKLKKIIEFNRSKSLIAAICAAPLILKEFEIININHKITCHPSLKENFSEFNYSDEKVVIDDNIITSRGAGTTFEFSFKILEQLFGEELADKIASDIVFKR